MTATQLCNAVQKLCAFFGVGWSQVMENDLPRKWERHGDMILLPKNCFGKDLWANVGLEKNKLWDVVAKTLNAKRLAQQTIITNDDFRTPQVVMLKGDNPIVVHQDNKIKYEFDVTKCMFSSGNITEKIRMAKLNCHDEVIVDMFAGIGYFTLPLLVHAKAKHVHACEWNPDAAVALKNNLALNKVSQKCTVHEGDNRKVCPQNVADRIILGLIPSAAASYEAACRALKQQHGGIMHIHENVTSYSQGKESLLIGGSIAFDKRISFADTSCNRTMKSDWLQWAMCTAQHLLEILDKLSNNSESKNWFVNVIHIERVKSYAPHIDHMVADMGIHPKSTS